MRRGFVLAVGVVVVAAGITLFLLADRAGERKQNEVTLTAVRTCANRSKGRHVRPNRRHDLVAGPVTFYGFRDASRAALRHPSRAFRTASGGYRLSEMVAEVGPAAVAGVSIARRDRGRARLLYRLPFPADKRRLGLRVEDGQINVRFEGCTPSQGRFSSLGGSRRGTFFNGGFVFTGPQCLRLDVYDHLTRTRGR